MKTEPKKCSKCKVEKPIGEFHKDARNKDGLRYQCKACTKAYVKAHYQENKDKKKAHHKVYHQENKAKRNAYDKAYYQENKVRINARRNAYQKERRANDPLFRLKRNARNRLYQALRREGYSKESSTQETLGIDYERYKKYIESKFKKGMSWDNYGEWHIDHIMPLATATTEEELLKLCHYSNTQPLWAEENLSKGSRII